MTRFGPLVDAAWLPAQLGAIDLVVVDCRFSLADPEAGRRGWAEAHIPGAAFLDLDRDLSGELREGGADGGRHPLPRPAAFEAAAGRAGIEVGSRVVAYDEAGEGGAARLWWLLRHFGHTAVAVLDGGLREWRAQGGELETGAPPSSPLRSFRARPRVGDTIAAGELAPDAAGPRPSLLDARTPERFRGELEPIDPVAGHIPGARNLPSSELAPNGRFLAPSELRERLGNEPFVAYCGSGVAACTLLVAAELAGVDARLYPGSWSEWSRRFRGATG